MFFKKFEGKVPENVVLLNEDDIVRWAEADITEIVRMCRARGIKVVIHNYPRYTERPNSILLNVALKFNIPFVDNKEIFRETMAREQKGDAEYFVADGHCTSKGYLLMATNVYNKILEEGIAGIAR